MTLAFVFWRVWFYFILPLAGAVFAWAALLKILCLETDLLVCFAGRVDAGVLSAPRGRVQAVGGFV